MAVKPGRRAGIERGAGRVRRSLAALAAVGVAAAAAAAPAAASSAGWAWEHVSPEASNGVNVQGSWGMPTGEHALYRTNSLAADHWIAQRSPTGWHSARAQARGTDVMMYVLDATPDLSRVVVRERPEMGVGDQRYRWSIYVQEGDRRHLIKEWMGPYADYDPFEGTRHPSNSRVDYVGGSRDLRTLVVMADPGELPAPESSTRMYWWVDGAVTPIDVDFGYPAACSPSPAPPAGVTATQDSGSGYWSIAQRRVGIGQTGISADGRTLVLAPQPCPAERIQTHLYVVRGETVIPISKPVPGGFDGPAEFVGMDEAGDRVFFTSWARVTPDDDDTRLDLYMWERDGNRVTRLSGDPVVRDADGVALGTAVASPTGSSVWWTMSDSRRSRHSVFAWRDGEVRFVRALLSQIPRGRVWADPAQVSYDGSAMVFASQLAVDPAFEARTGTSAVYRLGLDGRLDCLSCLGGTRVTQPASLGDTTVTYTGTMIDPRISRDGSTVAFQTSAGLVPADTNGSNDVYLWRDGVQTLVSSGIALDGSGIGVPGLRYAGMSWDGATVFFSSWGAFVPGSRDEYHKLYAARIGGGFPHDGEVDCGTECQPQPTPAPFLPVPGSATQESRGNVAEPPTLTVRAIGAAAQRRLARGGAVTVVARSSVAATVRAGMQVRLGGRWVRVDRGAQKLERAGEARIRLALSRRARRYLARRGTLRVRITVASSAVDGQRRIGFALRAARARQAGRPRASGSQVTARTSAPGAVSEGRGDASAR